MKIKKLISFLVALMMIFTLAACTDNTIVPEDEDEEVTLTLYFANQEYIMTGDDELDQVVSLDKDINLEERAIEEVIIEELQNEPEDENLTTMLRSIEILGVEIEENIAYVDFSSKDLSGGSLEETLILNQIVFSLTELAEVEQVQILVDGDIQETLMGHITIEEPLERSNN